MTDWKPNKWQEAVCLTYGDGDYRYLVDGREQLPGGVLTFEDQQDFDDHIEGQCGDTLFLFLMRELSDANLPDDSYGDEAVRLVKCAIRELETILPAVTLI